MKAPTSARQANGRTWRRPRLASLSLSLLLSLSLSLPLSRLPRRRQSCGRLGAIAQATQQASSAEQALPKGGEQALLAPLAQTALGDIADKLKDDATALSVYGATRDGKPATGGASTLGMPGSLLPIGAEIASAPLQKSIL